MFWDYWLLGFFWGFCLGIRFEIGKKFFFFFFLVRGLFQNIKVDWGFGFFYFERLGID